MSISILIAAAALATLTSASPAAHLIRADADPCAQWCDPWFAITDALDACNALVSDKGKNFEMCSGCSINHGGVIDHWAADYYGVAEDTGYNYMSDCKSCYNIAIPGINFGAVEKVYLDGIAVNSSSGASVSASLPAVAANTTAKATGASVLAAKTSSSPQASITPEALNDTSAASKSSHSRLSVTVLLALFAAFVGASI